MAANVQAIFPLVPNIAVATPLLTANTAKDGTGTVVTIHTAGANGSYIEDISILPLGTNVDTVLRIFLNNGGTNTTASNNVLFKEVTCPAATVSKIAAQTPITIQIEKAIPADYRLLATIGTTIAAGLAIICTAGDY